MLTKEILTDALSVLQKVPPNYFDYGERGKGTGWDHATEHKERLIFDIVQELDHDDRR